MSALPHGWTALVSKSTQRPYFVHAATGRRQWHVPDAALEEDRDAIRALYDEDCEGPGAPTRAFLRFLTQAVFRECTQDLACDYMAEFKYSVLDVGCGAGDVAAWKALKATSYLGMDASDLRIKHLLKGFGASKDLQVQAFCGDFTTSDAWERVPAAKIDVITCLEAAHFAFAEKASARAFFAGLSRSLSERGRVILSVADAECWRSSPKRTWGDIRIRDVGPAPGPSFGDRYLNYVDGEAREPSWWVSTKVLRAEAAIAGLELVLDANLASVAAWLGVDTARSASARRMAWPTHAEALEDACGEQRISAEAWAAASFFRVLVLRRVGSTCCGGIAREFGEWCAAEALGQLDALAEEGLGI